METKMQTVVTTKTGAVTIYVWQEGHGSSPFQAVFQYVDRIDTPGSAWWAMWIEYKDGTDYTDISTHDTMWQALEAFLVHPDGFELPVEFAATGTATAVA